MNSKKSQLDVISKEYFPTSSIEILSEKFSLNFVSNLENLGIRNATHLWVDLGFQVNKLLLKAYPKLTYIICRATAVTNLDMREIQSMNIRIFSLNEHKKFLSRIPSTAELGWLLVQLSGMPIKDILAQGRNQLWDRSLLMRHDLRDKKLGIIGFGRLGKFIANYAQSFGMRVAYSELPEVIVESSFPRESIMELCASSDYLVLSASIKENFSPILDKQVLEGCKRGIKIVNISRGRLVDEGALYHGLRSNKIGFYASDCARFEEWGASKIDHETHLKLISLDNVLFTPHIGGYSYDAITKTSDHLAEYLVKGTCICIET